MLAKSSFNSGKSVGLPYPRFCALIPEGSGSGRLGAVWHGHSWMREYTQPPLGTPQLQYPLWEEPKSRDTGAQWPNIGTGKS